MKPRLLAFAAVLALSAATALHADVQARLNVIASALASARHLQLQRIAVGGFTDSSTGQRPPFADSLEADLRQALGHASAKWKVVAADGDTSTADALLTGTFARQGEDIQVLVELQGLPDGAVLWQRNAALDGADVDAQDLPVQAMPNAAVASPTGAGAGSGVYGDAAIAPEGAAAGAVSAAPGTTVPQAAGGPEELGAPRSAGDDGGDQVIPTLPGSGRVRYREHENTFDISLGYKAFMPTNSTFKQVVGDRLDGISLGLAFDDVLLVDFDFWSQDVNNVGTVQSLDYAGTSFALVYPFHFGKDRAFTLYLGPGGRFGSIAVNDPSTLTGDGVVFGNNAFEGVAGFKWKIDHVGLDLRYTYDFAYQYTGYHTARLGAFYEFGN